MRFLNFFSKHAKFDVYIWGLRNAFIYRRVEYYKMDRIYAGGTIQVICH